MLVSLPDLHGRADLLDAALEYYPSDTEYVFLGDAIDRGPDSRGVIRSLLKLSDAGRVTLLRGNHEWMLMRAIHLHRLALEDGTGDLFDDAAGEYQNWLRNGGRSVVREYGHFDLNAVPDELDAYLQRTQLVAETSRGVLCSHAAPPALVPRYGSVEDTVLWARPNEGPFPLKPHLEASVHGHTPLSEPTWVGQHLYTDLGAVFSGALCTVDLDSMQAVVLQGPGSVTVDTLPTLYSDEDGLVRRQAFRSVDV